MKEYEYFERHRVEATLRLVAELRKRNLEEMCSCQVQKEIENLAGWVVVAAAYKMCKHHQDVNPGQEICEDIKEFLDEVEGFVLILQEKIMKKNS